MIHGTTQKKFPILTLLLQGLVVLASAILVVTIISSLYQANNPPVYFKVISGMVTASDGITYSDARGGKKIPLNARTVITTDSQVASIQLWNGSVVILDSYSSIEFNRPNENEPEMSFAFNLLKGKVLVVNEKKGIIPIRIFIGSNFIVQASKSAMGLEVFPESKILDEVDCLFGNCLVNGVHLLTIGQNAQIGPGELIQVTEGESIDDWISLWEAGKLKRELKNLLISFLPTITPKIIQTLPIISTEQVVMPQVSNTSFHSPTPLSVVLQNMTPTLKRSPSPSPTLTPSRTNKPFKFPTFTKTLSRENDPSPSRTLTPSRTPVPQATLTQIPTPTLLPTNTPSPSDTPIPSETPSPVPTATPTLKKTPKPTDVPPTHTEVPPTATDVPPTATDVPPTPTDVLPTPTDVPQPTPTEILQPTATEVPL